jgi:methyl-accepting chemotaxis protein
MNYLKDMVIGRRILLGLGLLIALSAVQGVISIRSLDNVNKQSTEIAENWLPTAVLVSDMRATVNDYRIAKHLHALATEEAELDQLEQRMTADKEQVKKYMDAYHAIEDAADENAAAESKLFESFTADWNEYVSDTETTFIPLSRRAE